MGAGSSSSDNSDGKKTTVCVVGGGMGGAIASRTLINDPSVVVILIDSKEFFEYTPSSVYSTLGASHDEIDRRLASVCTKHSNYLKPPHQAIVGTITQIGDDFKSVTLSDGKIVEFDFLVLATGSTYHAPWKCPVDVTTQAQRSVGMQQYFDQISEAKEILVIGGGPVGVEVAAEIIVRFPQKTIHLVHSQPRILEREPQTFSDAAMAFFAEHKVNVHVGTKAVKVENEDKEAKYESYKLTESNKIIKADLVLPCIGQVPCTSFMKPKHQEHLTERNLIKVNEFLQLHGTQHVFAIGDCNDVLVEKMAKNAKEQAHIAVANIKAVRNKQALTKIGNEPPGMLVSLGPDAALMKFYLNITGWCGTGSSMASFIKHKVAKDTIASLQ